MCSDNWSFNFNPHLFFLTLSHFLKETILNLKYVKENLKYITTYLLHRNTNHKKKTCSLLFHSLTAARTAYFLICSVTSPTVTFPGCKFVIYQRHNMVPEGWTCFPGSVKPARIHMLVSEQELTLNQPKLCQQKLRATIICPIDRWVVYLGAGGAGEREEAVRRGGRA